MKIVSEPKVAHYLKADPSHAFWYNPFTQCVSSFYSLSAWFPAPAFPQQFPVPALSSELNHCQPNVTSLPVRETKENDLLLPLPVCPADSSADVGVAPCCKPSHDVAVISITKRPGFAWKQPHRRCSHMEILAFSFRVITLVVETSAKVVIGLIKLCPHLRLEASLFGFACLQLT